MTRRSDELAERRQNLPWVLVDKEYRFETGEETKTLPELFDGRSQLFTYHFMFAPSVEGWPEAGCPGNGAVYHTYSTYDRGTDVLNATWQLLDRAPGGHGGEPEGWPRRHDEY